MNWHKRVRQRRDLIAHARPVMEYLHLQTRHSESLVTLADDRGLLLQALGDSDFLSRAERVALVAGASWHERDRGDQRHRHRAVRAAAAGGRWRRTLPGAQRLPQLCGRAAVRPRRQGAGCAGHLGR
jgi:hypothetical protein